MATTFLKTYYELESPDYSPQDIELFKSRWHSDLKTVREQISQAIDNHDKNLLDTVLLNFNKVSYTYHTKNVELLDLRGIDLSNLSFGHLDFSYCCFDFANLDNCFFNETGFQYSSIKSASLKNTCWIYAQASPVSLVESDLSNSVIKRSFFMHSDFYQANTQDLLLIDTGVEGSQLNMYNPSTKKPTL